MLAIGRFNRLTIVDQTRTDYLLDGGGKYGDIPLAKTEVPKNYRLGDDIDVFIYLDDEGYLEATTETPFAQSGEIAWLRVTECGQDGAWLDIGLKNDLFLPRSEQQHPLDENRYCMVAVFWDDKKGLIASTYLNDFLKDESSDYEAGQKVGLMIANSTELGYKVVIDHKYWGVLYANEVFQNLHKGQKIEGYIKKLREDKRLDVSLTPLGYVKKMDGISGRIMDELAASKGFLPISDKSSPEEIYAAFGVSKKAFKQAIGALYKQRLLVIEENGIRQI